MSAELRRQIADQMSRIPHMVIATCKKNQSWAATVFYAFDDDLNLYFLSRNFARHSQEILSNPQVSVVINEQWAQPAPLRGLQIEGLAYPLRTPDEVARAFGIYVMRFPSIKRYLDSPERLLAKNSTTQIFRVRPKRIWFLNEPHLGSGVRQVLNIETGETSIERPPGNQ